MYAFLLIEFEYSFNVKINFIVHPVKVHEVCWLHRTSRLLMGAISVLFSECTSSAAWGFIMLNFRIFFIFNTANFLPERTFLGLKVDMAENSRREGYKCYAS